MFMLGSSSSWALLFLQHIQENSNPSVPPDVSDYKPYILVQTFYVFAWIVIYVRLIWNAAIW